MSLFQGCLFHRKTPLPSNMRKKALLLRGWLLKQMWLWDVGGLRSVSEINPSLLYWSLSVWHCCEDLWNFRVLTGRMGVGNEDTVSLSFANTKKPTKCIWFLETLWCLCLEVPVSCIHLPRAGVGGVCHYCWLSFFSLVPCKRSPCKLCKFVSGPWLSNYMNILDSLLSVASLYLLFFGVLSQISLTARSSLVLVKCFTYLTEHSSSGCISTAFLL